MDAPSDAVDFEPAAAAVLDRLPDARQRQRGRGRRAGGVPALPPRARRGRGDRVAEGVPVRRVDPAAHRPPALGAGAPRDLRRRVAARAAADRRRRPDPARRAPSRPTRCRWRSCSLLERLSPVERAVFLLHDVFGYDYDEIAGDRRQERGQLPPARRCARGGTSHEQPAALRGVARASASELAARFFAAVGEGDIDGLVELLAADVVVYGDGGGKRRRGRADRRPRPRRPAAGRPRPADRASSASRCAPAEVNGQPGALCATPTGADQRLRARHRRRRGADRPLGHQPGQAAPPRPAGRRRGLLRGRTRRLVSCAPSGAQTAQAEFRFRGTGPRRACRS